MKISVRQFEGGRMRISIGRDVVFVKTQNELEAFWAGFRAAHIRISEDLLAQAKTLPYPVVEREAEDSMTPNDIRVGECRQGGVM